MKKRLLRPDTVYAIMSFLSLFYMYYYQAKLYYRPQMKFAGVFDILYGYISIPVFYFFIAAFCTAIILFFIRPRLSNTLCKILASIIKTALILYLLLITIKCIGIITVPVIGFIPIYLIVFGVLGAIFALTTYRDEQ